MQLSTLPSMHQFWDSFFKKKKKLFKKTTSVMTNFGPRVLRLRPLKWALAAPNFCLPVLFFSILLKTTHEEFCRWALLPGRNKGKNRWQLSAVTGKGLPIITLGSVLLPRLPAFHLEQQQAETPSNLILKSPEQEGTASKLCSQGSC